MDSYSWITIVGRPAMTYIYQLCADIRCRPEDLRRLVDDWDGWWESQRDPFCRYISMMMVYQL